MTDNKNRSASEIRSTFSKYNGNLGISGSVKHNFKKVGIITYAKEVTTFENFFEFCVSLNINDVIENDNSFDVETDLEVFSQTLEALENKYSVPQFSSLEWKPLNTIEISNQDDAKSLLVLLEKLEELDDVKNVFANFNIKETLMEKLS